MRIGLFTDTYVPDINGVVTSIVTLKKALEEQGHTVFVIANQPSLLSTSFEDNVLRLPGIEIKFLYGYTLSSPIHFKAQKIIKDMNLDIIHVHSEFGIGIFARMVAKNLHIPLVSTYHTTYEDYTHYVNVINSQIVDNLSKKAVAKFSKMLTKSSEIVIAPSHKTKEMLEGYSIYKKIEVIPTGLDLKRFKNADETKIQQIKETYNIKDDEILFIYIGRLAKEKSVDVVIDAFAPLSKEENVRLMIVGDGPSMNDLQQQAKKLGIEDKVIFVGKVMGDDVPLYYQCADAFVSASLTETQGLTYIEALACGLCVFARPDEPLDEIILEDETGYLFSNTKEFVDKAKNYIHMSEKRKEDLVKRAHEMANKFSLEVFADSVNTVYNEAISLYHEAYSIVRIENYDDFSVLILKIDTNDKTDEKEFIISDFILERRKLQEGDSVSRLELNEIEDDDIIYKAFQKALKKIAIKDYSSYEMRDYLNKVDDLTDEQIDIVINLLVKRRFIDDKRYLEDKVNYMVYQNYGNFKIIKTLSEKGFGEIEVEKVLNNYKDGYLDRGLEMANHYLKTPTKGSRRQIEYGLKRYLIRNGYELSIIEQIISNLPKIVDKDTELDHLRNGLVKTKRRLQRKHEGDELNQKIINYMIQKGYNYDDVVTVMKEINDED